MLPPTLAGELWDRGPTLPVNATGVASFATGTYHTISLTIKSSSPPSPADGASGRGGGNGGATLSATLDGKLLAEGVHAGS